MDPCMENSHCGWKTIVQLISFFYGNPHVNELDRYIEPGPCFHFVNVTCFYKIKKMWSWLVFVIYSGMSDWTCDFSTHNACMPHRNNHRSILRFILHLANNRNMWKVTSHSLSESFETAPSWRTPTRRQPGGADARPANITTQEHSCLPPTRSGSLRLT